MRISSRLIGALLLSGLSCRTDGPLVVAPSVQPAPTPRPPASGACKAGLSEFVGSQGFPVALVKDGAACAPFSVVEERHCAGSHIAIVESGGYGGVTRYFDGKRVLIGAFVTSDYNQYCNGSSFDIIYGTRPTCPTPEVVTNLCRP